MDLTYNADHESFREAAREFAVRVVAPGLRERDADAKAVTSIYKKMGEEGFLGCSIPTQYGGLGLDYHTLAIASEEFEYVDSSARVILSVHNGLHSLALLQWGTEAQKQKYLVPLARGEKLSTFCLTEPAAGSDVAGIQSFAEKKDGRYVLNGEKIWISLSTVADVYLVMAYIDRARQVARDHSGIAAFLVERNWKGVAPFELHGKLGVRAMLASMAQSRDIGDLLVRRCGWMKNTGQRCTREVALAKWTNTVAAQAAADNAIEIHGAYGFCNEFPVERFWRNSRGAVIYEGTKEVQQIIQAEYALGYRKDGAIRCELPAFK